MESKLFIAIYESLRWIWQWNMDIEKEIIKQAKYIQRNDTTIVRKSEKV